MALAFAIVLSYNLFVSVHSLFLYFYKAFFKPVRQKSMIPACPSLMCCLAGVMPDQLFLRKFVFDACTFCFIFVLRLILWVLESFVV